MCIVDVDPTMVERPIVCHVIDDFINDRTMSNFPSDFDESNDLFDFNAKEFNTVSGTSSVGDTSDVSTPRTSSWIYRYVAQNGNILISSAPGQDKPISPHVIRFSNTIGVLTRDTFLVCFLKLADVTSEYIELIKDDLQYLLDLLSIKCSSYGRSSKATTTAISRSLMILNRLMPTHRLRNRVQDWHFFCDHYLTRQFLEQSSMNKAARVKQPCNHSGGAKDEICQTVLGRLLGYSKGLGWGSKPTSRHSASNSLSTSDEQKLAHAREVNELKTHLEVVEEYSNKKHEESAHLIEAQSRHMEEMRKMIEELSRTSRGP
ncbi:CACTA en-spm transposon protein [Cucumis melo var. makuwa]|uniref:CACTA en-spm transposon protein n=1 Tax=Cucumis melo var. makuwa TaxID=1194695 RepID=A0A5A7UMU0_CUCMM|nr:CACTA en-spm transposon protein [Cucumis melo var. makuwa]TYK22733.1 CACTA en-spm transposon protein [Cucumis melo var. makuwa]